MGLQPATEAILQYCVYIEPGREVKPQKSPVFAQTSGERATENAISQLRESNCADLNHVERVVFIQNFLPLQDSVQSLNTLKGDMKYKDSKIEIVCSQPLPDDVRLNLANNIKLYQIKKWRQLGFLLWNADHLPKRDQDLEWWKLPFEKCEDDLEKGLQNAGIEYVHSRNCMEELLKKLVYAGKNMTNIKRNKAVECLSIKQYVKEVFQRQ